LGPLNAKNVVNLRFDSLQIFRNLFGKSKKFFKTSKTPAFSSSISSPFSSIFHSVVIMLLSDFPSSVVDVGKVSMFVGSGSSALLARKTTFAELLSNKKT